MSDETDGERLLKAARARRREVERAEQIRRITAPPPELLDDLARAFAASVGSMTWPVRLRLGARGSEVGACVLMTKSDTYTTESGSATFQHTTTTAALTAADGVIYLATGGGDFYTATEAHVSKDRLIHVFDLGPAKESQRSLLLYSERERADAWAAYRAYCASDRLRVDLSDHMASRLDLIQARHAAAQARKPIGPESEESRNAAAAPAASKPGAVQRVLRWLRQR